MKMKVYSLKDALTGFKGPFVSVNDGNAIRDIKIAMASADKAVIYDYSLYYLGELDDQTGEFVSEVKWLANCVDLLRPEVKVEVKEEEKKEIE